MKKILFILIALIVSVSFLFAACDNTDDENNCNNETNDLRDDNSPSGGDCDDECNDDDDDDDDDDGGWCGGPEIANGQWNPIATAYDPYTDIWYGWSSFLIYDVDDNLSGGNIYYLKAGTHESILDEPFISWDDYIAQYGLDDVTDYTNFAEVKILIEFGSGPEPLGLGIVCVDIETSDGQANFSNKLTDLCVYVI